MSKQQIYCIHCGSDMVESGYNYETAHTEYTCQECGETFTQWDIPICEGCGKQILEEEFVFLDETLCKDCYNKKLDSWVI